MFYEEIELDLSAPEGLAGTGSGQGEERTYGICMAESELAGPHHWRSLELHTTAWFLFILVSVLQNVDVIRGTRGIPTNKVCVLKCVCFPFTPRDMKK